MTEERMNFLMASVGQAQIIATALNKTVFRFSDEMALQNGIEELFKKQGWKYERESILSPRNRIDFMVHGVGIEVKVDSSPNTVQRQLWRYADDSRIGALVLVTTRSSHKTIPNVILDKPVLIVHLLNSIF